MGMGDHLRLFHQITTTQILKVVHQVRSHNLKELMLLPLVTKDKSKVQVIHQMWHPIHMDHQTNIKVVRPKVHPMLAVGPHNLEVTLKVPYLNNRHLPVADLVHPRKKKGNLTRINWTNCGLK